MKQINRVGALSIATLLVAASLSISQFVHAATITPPSSFGGGGRVTNPRPIITPPVVTTQPPPDPVVPPTTNVPPPRTDFINPILNPIDVTHTTNDMRANGDVISFSEPIEGIADAKAFPSPEELKGPTDFLLVQKQTEQDETKRETPYLVNLNRGLVLASVRRPSQMGMLHTPMGDVAFQANSDAFVSFGDGLMHVRNVDGLGQTIKVKVNGGGTYAIAPGYELIVADHKLSREEMRPSDGILRRKTRVLPGGTAAVCQYSVESALQQSALISNLQQQHNDNKSRRVLSDMSRMAAVLNHINGVDGYTQ